MKRQDPFYGLTSAEVPQWLRTPWIETGYRFGGTARGGWMGLFRWHNETLNTWTMLVPSVVSGVLLMQAASSATAFAPLAPLAALHLSALVHLPFSLGYHLLSPVSPAVRRLWLQLDVMFIFVGSVLLTYALGACVVPRWALALMVAGSVAVLAQGARHLARIPKDRPIDRAPVVVLVGAAVAVYLLPMAWASVVDPGRYAGHLLAVVSSLGLGASAYAWSWPERHAPPGRFDMAGNSHNIMHVAIGVAHLVEWSFVRAACRG